MTHVRAITLSPVVLDQAFPRSENELRVVASSLGDLQEDLEKGAVILIFPEVFEHFMSPDMYLWQQGCAKDSWLRDIANHLFLILTRLGSSVIRLPLEVISGGQPHPVPGGAASYLTDEWAIQMASLLVKHDSLIAGDGYFIGIACPYRYAGIDSGGYAPPLPARYFPLVSSETARTQLVSYVTYRCPPNVKTQRLTYRHVRQNFKSIGGIALKDVPGSDHQRLNFSGNRWVEFDTGGKRDGTLIPDAWTKQICAKLDLPDDAADGIKASLIMGRDLNEFAIARLAGAERLSTAV